MQRVLYLIGALAAPLFLASVLFGGARRTGYSHLVDPVSLLGMSGAADAGLINGLWALTGLLIMVLAGALWTDTKGPGRSTAAWLFIAGAGSAAIAIWFPMDPPGVPVSRAGIGHIVLVVISGIAFALALITAARSATMPRAYRRFTWIALAAMVAGGVGAALAGALGWPLLGFFERVTQSGYHAWLLVTAISGFRQSGYRR